MSVFEADRVEPAEAPGRGRVWRVEVHPADAGDDPLGRSILHEAEELRLAEGITAVHTSRVYLIQAKFEMDVVERIARELLADPVNQRYRLGATPREEGRALVEVHYLPGVMDPVAESAREAIGEMLGEGVACEVRTGFRYDLVGASGERARTIAERLLANPVIHSVSDAPQWPRGFVEASAYEFRLIHVPIRGLGDEDLMRLSREGHLFLSLEEMRAIRDYYRGLPGAGDREPTDVELETFAQTWSEHCVHKTLKSRVRYTEGGPGMAMPGRSSPGVAEFAGRPGHSVAEDGSLVIDNLLRSTIAAATHKLIEEGVDWCVSVFVDNAGIVRFDETDAVTFKVETHNHPSAIEPYGGAATGIGGCIRDTLGTGLAARPIANTDVFAVADPGYSFEELPSGVIHPRRVLKQVVAGVRDYGNRMGIPTVNGAVWFDDRYLGNPLVFAGSVGLIPADKCFGEPRAGDRIIAVGGRTGRDGIHGATFSSAELTDTHADEFSHAVQIGNPITQKKMLDVILQARDHESGCLYSAITDCGAGGFSSAIGEMGEKLGAFVQLERAPLKYEGLSYTEIWISEAQERMVLAVPPEKAEALRGVCEAEGVEVADLGHFGTEGAELVLTYEGHEVGRMSMAFLHEGLPTPRREARWDGGGAAERSGGAVQPGAGVVRGAGETGSTRSGSRVGELLVGLLGHPNIASKHWVVRQYDHEVQGSSAIKPLVGPGADGPSDAAVLRPKLGSMRGVALSCGLATGLGELDPYWMALAAIDEAVRNAVCVGARADRIAILDNFCWPGCDDPRNLGALVRAAAGCYDGALAYRTPFISGKDSLNNQFTTDGGRVIEIPYTLLISALGMVEDAGRCVSMEGKSAGNLLVQVGLTAPGLGGSHVGMIDPGLVGGGRAADFPRVDLGRAPGWLAAVAGLIGRGLARSAHDCSEGGLLVAAAEMAFAGRLGLELDLEGVPRHEGLDEVALCFAETPTRILLEVAPGDFDEVAGVLRCAEVPFGHVGTFNDGGRLTVRSGASGELVDVGIEELREVWRGVLDW